MPVESGMSSDLVRRTLSLYPGKSTTCCLGLREGGVQGLGSRV